MWSVFVSTVSNEDVSWWAWLLSKATKPSHLSHFCVRPSLSPVFASYLHVSVLSTRDASGGCKEDKLAFKENETVTLIWRQSNIMCDTALSSVHSSVIVNCRDLLSLEHVAQQCTWQLLFIFNGYTGHTQEVQKEERRRRSLFMDPLFQNNNLTYSLFISASRVSE